MKERFEDHLFEKGVQRETQCVSACEVVSSREARYLHRAHKAIIKPPTGPFSHFDATRAYAFFLNAVGQRSGVMSGKPSPTPE